MLKADGKKLVFDLEAPEQGASVQVKDGDRLLYEGKVSGNLRVEVEGAEWELPDGLLGLIDQRLPPLEDYSPASFGPLETSFISLSTVNLKKGNGGPAAWTRPGCLRGQQLPISVLAGTIHYAQSVFEGAKAFFVAKAPGEVEARLFRPKMNAERLWRSAMRMGIPLGESTFEGESLTQERFVAFYSAMVTQAVLANARAGLFGGSFSPVEHSDPNFSWNETPRALYIRPVLFATGPVLGVKPASHYTFAVYVTPAGRYRSDLVLRIERDHPRAYPGGTGAVKASCNYAPTLSMMADLVANRSATTEETPWQTVYDDILFLSPEDCIEEMGGANFFVLGREGDRLLLRTPPSRYDSELADTILPGVTRNTIINLAEILDLDVEIGPLPLARLLELGTEQARDTAVFTTGTAAGIAPVLALLDGENRPEFARWDDVADPARNRRLTADPAPEGSPLAMGLLLRTLLFRVQLGDEAGIRELVPDKAESIFLKMAESNWVDSFPV